jgi:glycine/D-amino acid oxidase-like deaminating enzyme
VEKAPTVLVVGAGVIGLACAFRIAREGRRVILVDRAAPGRATSFGNAGHIATEQVFPLASPEVIRGSLGYLLDRDSPLRIHPRYAFSIAPWLLRFAWAARGASFERGTAAIVSLMRTARDDLRDLLWVAGASDQFHEDGHLVLVERAESVLAAKAEVWRMRTHGVKAAWRSAGDVQGLVPELAAPIEGAWHFSGTGHVEDPYAVCQAFEAGFRAAGGKVVQGEVLDIESTADGIVARTDSGDALEANQLVLSAGAWSKALAARLGHRVPLDTERGYHITMPQAFPTFRLPVASFERKVIMTPMSVGLRMTGTVEFGGLTLPPDPNRFSSLHRHLKALVPSLPTHEATTWMGHRPSLPDHLPVLGRVPDGRPIFLAFGHQHLGLTLAGVTARVVADLVMDRKPDIDLAPFSPLRFR